MSVSKTASSFEEFGNGTITDFVFDFEYAEGNVSQVKAELYDITGAEPVKVADLVSGIDYSVSNGVLSTFGIYSPIATGQKIRIYRQGNLLQPSSFVNGAFPAEAIEETFDEVIFRIQEVNRAISEGVSIPVSPAETPSYVVLGVTGNHTADFGELIIVDTANPVDITLPNPQSNKQFIIIKYGANVTSKNIISASGIDGFVGGINIVSPYTSYTLVATNSKWYIL